MHLGRWLDGAAQSVLRPLIERRRATTHTLAGASVNWVEALMPGPVLALGGLGWLCGECWGGRVGGARGGGLGGLGGGGGIGGGGRGGGVAGGGAAAAAAAVAAAARRRCCVR